MTKLFDAAKSLYAREPARVIAVTAAVVVFAAAKAGLVVPQLSVMHALEFALPLLLGGEAIRTQVSPKA